MAASRHADGKPARSFIPAASRSPSTSAISTSSRRPKAPRSTRCWSRSIWSHIASRLRPTDRVEVHAEDGSWFAELYVRDAGHLHATLVPLRVFEFDDDRTASRGRRLTRCTGRARITAGPWCGSPTARLVKTECASREEAQMWLAGNARTLRA